MKRKISTLWKASAALMGAMLVMSACGSSEEAATSEVATPTEEEVVVAQEEGAAANWDGTPLTFVTWGGTTEEGIKSSMADPFTQLTGITTQMVNPVDYGKYQAQLDTGDVTWDWVDLEGWFVLTDTSKWADLNGRVTYDPNDFVELPGANRGIPSWGVPSFSYSFAMAHRTDKEGAKPSTWVEFFDTKNFPGKRSIYNWPYGMLEIALLGDGVPFDQLYPLDVDRALKKLDSVRNDLVFWNSGAELQQQMTTGAADFFVTWNNRVTALAKDGQPVALEWGENLQDGGYMVTAAGGPHEAQMMEFFSFALTPEAQSGLSNTTGYSPATKSGFALIEDQWKPWYSAYPENLEKAVGTIDLEWWSKNMDSAATSWNTWAGS